jgi:hypothetical protein
MKIMKLFELTTSGFVNDSGFVYGFGRINGSDYYKKGNFIAMLFPSSGTFLPFRSIRFHTNFLAVQRNNIDLI